MPKSKTKLADDWFAAQGWKPFAFQRRAWRAYLEGKNVLIHSATGTGKTLAAWLGPLLQWHQHPMSEHQWTQVKGKADAPPLLALWVTPLRALAGDTTQSLQRAIEGLHVPWKLESRTGDTSSSVKQRQRQRLPTALVTTPESLALMLSYPNLASSLNIYRLLSSMNGTN